MMMSYSTIGFELPIEPSQIVSKCQLAGLFGIIGGRRPVTPVNPTYLVA